MAKIASFRELIVWQKGMDLTELVRRLKLLGADVVAGFEALAIEVGRMLYGLWRALAPAAVCYSLIRFAFGLGLGPWPQGLPHGFTLFT